MSAFARPLFSFLLGCSIATSVCIAQEASQRHNLPGHEITDQKELVDLAIAREKDVVRILRERAPLIETYIQNMRTDKRLGQVPTSDVHFLSRVSYRHVIDADKFQSGPLQADTPEKERMLQYPRVGFSNLIKSLGLRPDNAGYAQMTLMDSNDFNRDHYSFTFVRKELLGATPTAVFEVKPITGKDATGRFDGLMWVETRGGNVVRFKGTYDGSQRFVREYYQFDSWRTNVQPDLWLPTTFYVEEMNGRNLKFKSSKNVWGYLLALPGTESENTSLDVVGATDVSNDARDISPLGAERMLIQKAEDNVIDRLFRAGLIDAPSQFDKTLEAIAQNILVYNNIALPRPIRCRTLLTEPLESLAIGNTILLSKGLIDTTSVPSRDGAEQMGNLNALLAFQLAHILLGHRLDTGYAFDDTMLFPATAVFRRIPMRHTDADNKAAARKAMDLLSAKELVDGQKYFGLYLEQLEQRLGSLRELNDPMIGDGLSDKREHQFWMSAMMTKAPKLDETNLQQQAAMPLASFLRRDPWTNEVIATQALNEQVQRPSEKMPFEVTPVYFRLNYYHGPNSLGSVQPTTDPASEEAKPR